MKRRNFIKTASVLGIASALPTMKGLADDKKKKQPIKEITGADDRTYWTDLLYRIAQPILSNMSKGELRKNMSMVVSPIWDGRDKNVGYLEAFGRLMAGLAPWLNLPDDNTPESSKRKQLREWTLQSMAHAVNPDSPDYLAWNAGSQPLVDAAYLANSLIRGQKTLWEPLDTATKQYLIKEFKGLRRVKPAYNNWLLFAAMTESFLLSIGEEYDAYRIEMGIRKMNEWYEGDGWYADGSKFAMDYYNAFVIHPMMVEICDLWVHKAKRMPKQTYETALKRMQRYADFLERIISPEGSYPAFGRSITYRMAAFQPLGLLAYMEKLPEHIGNAQVRCALTAVMRRMFAIEENFDTNNFLQLGFAGSQPNLADYYTNTGSLYLTSLGFLPLGLPATHEFWSAPAADWTAKKAWSGQPFPKDYAVDI